MAAPVGKAVGGGVGVSKEMAVRVWKRDGTANFMTVDAALENLKRNGPAWVRGPEGLAEARAELREGRPVETPFAEFWSAGAYYRRSAP